MGLKFHSYDLSGWAAAVFDGLSDRLSEGHSKYLFRYLGSLGCTQILEETVYIDRDFHEEFSEFYGTTPSQPPSTCRRLHFFAPVAEGLTAESFGSFLSGDRSIEVLQGSYLGCCVIRPHGIATFGRTLLRSHPNIDGAKIRHFEPARRFDVNLAGLKLHIDCVPWQQQDMGVCACAGVSIWSMLQSVAHREGIAVPTTVRVARAATKYSLPLGRALPPGLSLGQLCESIRDLGLAPLVIQGDVRTNGMPMGFSRHYFSKLCAMVMRGRLPVLLAVPPRGYAEEGHAVLAVGYQELVQTVQGANSGLNEVQGKVSAVYIHDDNFGPSMRHEVRTADHHGEQVVNLIPVPPNGGDSERPDGLVPSVLLLATPNKLRVSPAELLSQEMIILDVVKKLALRLERPSIDIWSDTSFVLIRDYLGAWATRVHHSGPKLAAFRRDLQEVHPLPRYLGLLRVHNGGEVCIDLIFDTTSAPRRPSLRAAVVFSDFGMELSMELGIENAPSLIDNR